MIAVTQTQESVIVVSIEVQQPFAIVQDMDLIHVGGGVGTGAAF